MKKCNNTLQNPKVFLKKAVIHGTGKIIRKQNTMGMAASQAQLLSITAQMHEIERHAQAIENCKIELATKKDEIYKKYCDALDAKKIQVAIPDFGSGKMNYVDANYKNVCSYQPGRAVQYALRDSRTNKLIVPQDVYDKIYGSEDEIAFSDKYSFAWAMLGLDCDSLMFDSDYEMDEGKDACYVGSTNDSDDFVTMSGVEEYVYNRHQDDEKLVYYHDLIDPEASTSDVKEKTAQFRDYLYSKYGNEIKELMCVDKDASSIVLNEDGSINTEDTDIEYGDYDPSDLDIGKGSEFQYYVNLYEAIKEAGGCTSIDALAEDGDAGNDWFNNMVNSGRVLIDYYNYNNPEKGWTETSVATSTQENFLQEVHDDSNDKIAEAEYEHELGLINKKDQRYDRELSNLETERNALKTEQDALKTIIKDNEDRTFGIFS